MAGLQVGESAVVDGAKGVDRAVLIRPSMGASRRFVKKRQRLPQSLAVRPPIVAPAPARAGPIGGIVGRRLRCGGTWGFLRGGFALSRGVGDSLTDCGFVPLGP